MTYLSLPSDQNLLVRTEKVIAGILFRLAKHLPKLPWAFAMLGFITVGLAYTLITWIPVLLLRRRNAKLIREIVASIDEFDERDLMRIHLSYEDIVVCLESVVRRTNSFFVFKPLNKQFSIMLADTKQGFAALSEFLYPDLDKPLSLEEGTELIEAYKPWNENSKEAEFSLNG